jgi:hypothetical protein
VGDPGISALLGRPLDNVSANADARHDDGRNEWMVCQQMMRLQKSRRSFKRSPSRRMLLVTAYIFMLTGIVRADGGKVMWQRTAGPFRVTAFTTQSPLRKGPTDISFLVESTAKSRAIVDAQVFITLENESGTTVRAEATHTQARNKLLYCSLISLPEAGHWKMKIIVSQGGKGVELVDHLLVEKAQPMLLAYWKLVAFPPVIMILFIFNQWLRRSRGAKLGPL